MRVYSTVSGDTWDWIAKKMYNDESKASLLIEYNDEFSDTVVFYGNVKIKVPDLEPDPVNPLPPWRR